MCAVFALIKCILGAAGAWMLHGADLRCTTPPQPGDVSLNTPMCLLLAQAQLVHTGELQQQLHHSLAQLSAQLLGPGALPLPHPGTSNTLQPGAAAAAGAPPSSPSQLVQQQRHVDSRTATPSPDTRRAQACTSDSAGGWLWQVVGQRDVAAAALAEAQQQLVAQAAHIAEVHRQLAAAQAAGLPVSAGFATTAAQAQAPPATAAAAVPSLDLPGGPSGLSVLGDLPPSPGSGASFWLGPGLAGLDREGTTTSLAGGAAGPTEARPPAVDQQPTGRASPITTGGAAAAGGGGGGPSGGGLEDLLAKYGAQLVRSSSPDLGSPHSRAASPAGSRHPAGERQRMDAGVVVDAKRLSNQHLPAACR
jgi:hypothetical protein